jgi:hypothetical protein
LNALAELSAEDASLDTELLVFVERELSV